MIMLLLLLNWQGEGNPGPVTQSLEIKTIASSNSKLETVASSNSKLETAAGAEVLKPASQAKVVGVEEKKEQISAKIVIAELDKKAKQLETLKHKEVRYIF